MKTKEFIKWVENEGFTVNNDGRDLYISRDTNVIASIDLEKTSSLNTSYYAFEEYIPQYKKVLLDKFVEYSSTPISEREEPERFLYKFPYKINGTGEEADFHYIARDFGISLDSSNIEFINSHPDTYTFTDEEVERFTGKDRALFEICEKIK